MSTASKPAIDGTVSSCTVGQRANALLAEYVAIEVEQSRLSRVDHNDPRISALGERAIAIADALPKVVDPAGSIDHAAACILVEMMLQRHDWSRLDEIQFGEDDLESLAVLSALAGATTGMVREQTRRVLLKTGRDIGMEPLICADPMLDVVTRHKAWLAAYAGAPFDGGDEEQAWMDAHPNAEGDRLHFDPPMPTTTAGAVAAVRFVMEDVDYIQVSHARILGRALSFLEGDRSIPAPDPLAELVAVYNAQVAAEDALTDEELDALPLDYSEVERALRDPPIATSLAGVAAALRLVVSEDVRGRDCHRSYDGEPGLIERAVLPFLEGRAAR